LNLPESKERPLNSGFVLLSPAMQHRVRLDVFYSEGFVQYKIVI